MTDMPTLDLSSAGNKDMATTIAAPPVVSNIVSARIIHKETANGIANLQVDLFDLHNWPDPELGVITAVGSAAAPPPTTFDVSSLYRTADRAGSAVTDASGNVRFEITPNDFNLTRNQLERKPDLVLVVLAPDEPGVDLNARLLHM